MARLINWLLIWFPAIFFQVWLMVDLMSQVYGKNSLVQILALLGVFSKELMAATPSAWSREWVIPDFSFSYSLKVTIQTKRITRHHWWDCSAIPARAHGHLRNSLRMSHRLVKIFYTDSAVYWACTGNPEFSTYGLHYNDVFCEQCLSLYLWWSICLSLTIR